MFVTSSLDLTVTNQGIYAFHFSHLVLNFLLCISSVEAVSHWAGIHNLWHMWVMVEQQEVGSVFG